MHIDAQVVLASASPRRTQLLKQMGLRFQVEPSLLEESVTADTPEEKARLLAEQKALDVAKNHPDALVIGADTIVCIDDKVLGKPKDTQDAYEMLTLLSGREHKVISGICAVFKGRVLSRAIPTVVMFDTLEETEILEYIATDEPYDKAGAYAIQGAMGAHIRGINGCYYNVMGLPLNALSRLIKEILKNNP